MKVEMLRVKIVCEYSSNPFSFSFIATCHTCISLGLKVTGGSFSHSLHRLIHCEFHKSCEEQNRHI